jgi:putative alpha-1,2-mannosidase
MYHYANAPGFSTQRARQTIAQSFNASHNGLPGNDGAFDYRTHLPYQF